MMRKLISDIPLKWMLALCLTLSALYSANIVYSSSLAALPIDKSLTSNLFQNQSFLSLDQEDFFEDFAANIGVMAGIIYDLTGSCKILLFGSICDVLGSVVTCLSMSLRISQPEGSQIPYYFWVAASLGAFVSTCVIVTSVKKYHRNSGIVMGLLKGFVVLGVAIFMHVHRAVYGDNPTYFLLVVAWFPASMFLLFMFYLRPLPTDKEKEDVKQFCIFLGTCLLLAFFLFAVILVQNLTKLHRFTSIAFMAIMLFILFMILILKPDKNPKEKIRSIEICTVGTASETVQKSGTTKKLVLKLYKELRHKAKPGKNYTILQALTSLGFCIIFLATTAGLGCGLMTIYNLGRIGSSLGYSSSQVSTFESLLSIWKFFGRVAFGFLSQKAKQNLGVPRLFFLALILGIMSFGHLYLAFALPGAFYFGSVIVGMSFGGIISVGFAIISEIFGLKYFGTLYKVGILTSPLWTYLWKQVGNPGPFKSELVCSGSVCYKNTFIIMAACCCFGCIISLILSLMTIKVFKSLRLKPSDLEGGYAAKGATAL